MNTFQIVILLGLLGNVILGLFVLFSNPRRTLNIGFSILSFFIFLWLGAMFLCSVQHSDIIRLFWVRQCSAFAGWLPIGFFFICLAILNPTINFYEAVFKLRYLLLACFVITVLCHSSIFALSADPITAIEMVPPTQYGWGFALYIAFFGAVIVAMAVGFWKGNKQAHGVQKEELRFLQVGGCTSLIFGVSLLVSAEAIDNQEIARFMPLSVLMLDGFVAYGIATRRILAASVVLQRVVAYVLMACYLTLLYAITEWVAAELFKLMIKDTTYLSHLFAALVLAFSVAPAHGWMQAAAHRLFASAKLLDVDKVLVRASHIFQEVSVEKKLIEQFSGLVKDAFGTKDIFLLRLNDNGSFSQLYASVGTRRLSVSRGSCIARLLIRDHEPFTVDTLQRMRPTPLVEGARKELEELEMAAVSGVFLRKELKSILLLSQKRSGRIYDLREQRALQMLCDQLAVAQENSNLYTAVQNGKIYNEILLDSLTSGTIAVNADEVVTVFNRRAQALTGLNEAEVVGHSIGVLPPVLSRAIRSVLSSGGAFRDKDMVIPHKTDDEDVAIRVSGSLFRGHTGDMLGALLIFNDMTVLKKMEEQIRRTDRLSSIGTLSAGMAHEIKNPLVTIKTFTQLLPQQYDDSDFRTTFSDLVGQEVGRIDTIVNRLLNFARPAKAALKPVSLHEVVDNSLRLVEQQLLQSQIKLERHLDAKRHIVNADAEQLNQTFINFFLNAVHAMEQGGRLCVQTAVVAVSQDTPQVNGLRPGDYIQLDIADSGSGIPPDRLNKIFDPFYTTKEDGVGLGLSVTHGIIQEHDGIIDVESEVGKGTVFHIQFPLISSMEKVSS